MYDDLDATLTHPVVSASALSAPPLRPYHPDADIRIAAGVILAMATLAFVLAAVYFTVHPVYVPGL
jgi:hypothetical protein